MIKLDKFILKMIGMRILSILCNGTIYYVVGILFGVINAFIHYFGDGDIMRAIFWMLFALVCVMNLKEIPK